MKPLARGAHAATPESVSSALRRIDDRAIGEFSLSDLRDLMGIEDSSSPRPDRDSADYAWQMIALAQTLYTCRRITTAEYVLYPAHPVEDIHSSRWFGEVYDVELGPLSSAMRAIETREGLQPDEYWALGDAPDDYAALNRQYERVLEAKFIETLREFKLDELANMKANNPKEFDRLRERGRRALFHADELVPAIRDVVARCERDALRSAAAGAFSAAITSLGAGVEGLLLLRCMRSPSKAVRVARSLPPRMRPRHLADLTSWGLDNLIAVCDAAGWLPPIDTSVASYSSSGLAHLLRAMRNYVHPGRYARERPWTEPDDREYKDAEAVYVLVLAIVGRSARTLGVSNKRINPTRRSAGLD